MKRRLGRLYAALHAREACRRIVLLYHSIGGGPDSTPTKDFGEQLNLIAKVANLQPLSRLLGSTPESRAAVAITFDDGYATLRDHAGAVLTNFGVTATIFLNVGEIDENIRRPTRSAEGYYSNEYFLSWRDVDALIEANWQIAAHGVRHLDLTTSKPAIVRSELRDSKARIEKRLGGTCNMFAYPWGRNNLSIRTEVRAAGYQYAFAGSHGHLTAQMDSLAIPRINIAKEYECDDLAAILHGDWDYLRWLAEIRTVTNSLRKVPRQMIRILHIAN